MMKFNVFTIFPSMFESPFEKGVISKAVQNGLININTVDIRDYTDDKHRTTDDYQYGGGAGLVMKPEPIVRAVRKLQENEKTHVVLLEPRGGKFTQETAERLAQHDSVSFICGRYEGVDERVRDLVVDEVLSVGDFVLTGGELAAMIIIDAVSRLKPGVLGDDTSAEDESFTTGVLEYPHYTRPAEYEGMQVPEVLQTGNHADIVKWRSEQSLVQTRKYRPDLLPFDQLDVELRRAAYKATALPVGRKLKLAVALLHYPMKDKKGKLVTTSITNMDLHDISRSSATYGAERYYVVTPLKAQREIAEKVISHWTNGYGSKYNENRKEAFARTELCDSLLTVLKKCEDHWGEKPLVVSTTARPERATISAELLGDMAGTKPVLLLFGTGWGFVPEIFELSDYIVEPVLGAGDFNHLSVRSAAAILLDRLTRKK